MVRASFYVVGGVALVLAWWRIGARPAARPSSCQDLAPKAVAALRTPVAPPTKTPDTAESSFRRRIDAEIVRLLRQVEDVKDSTTLITDARRIADYTRADESSGPLRDGAEKLETLLRTANLLAQSDIERQAIELKKSGWLARTASKLGPDADFKTLERTFGDDVVRRILRQLCQPRRSPQSHQPVRHLGVKAGDAVRGAL